MIPEPDWPVNHIRKDLDHDKLYFGRIQGLYGYTNKIGQSMKSTPRQIMDYNLAREFITSKNQMLDILTFKNQQFTSRPNHAIG